MTTTTPSSPMVEAPLPSEFEAAAPAFQDFPQTGRRRWWIGLVLIGALAGGSAGFYYLRPRVGKLEADLFTVTRRDFTVALHEKGELKAAKSIDIKCEVEGRSTIIWLVPEGTEAAEGDLLVKLASEEIDDRVRSEEIKEANAKAAAESAAKEYEITLDEQASQIRKAELTLQNAEIELKKYVEGDWVQQKTDADLAVKRAAEDYRQKAAKLQDSKDLYEQYLFSLAPGRGGELAEGSLAPALKQAFADHGLVLSPEVTAAPDENQADKWLILDTDRRYNARVENGELRVYYERNFITKLDLERDEFALLEAEMELEKVKLRKEILYKYSNPKDLQQKTSDMEEAQKQLERTRKSAEAKIAQALATRDARAAEYAFTQQQLEKFRRQQAKTEIRAPAAGLVVYDTGEGRWNRREISEGAEVYERQTIAKLPDTAVMQAIVRVHEGRANKVQMGQKVRVEVEGLPGVILEGKVTKIAPLADSENTWLNPELKEYVTEITLTSNGYTLKPGATARVEILVDEVHNAPAVPVQTVVTKQGRRYVFRGRGDTPEPVQVELGRSNEEFVEVLNGLAEGDVVRLSISEESMQRIPELPQEEQPVSPPNGVAEKREIPKPAPAPEAGSGGPGSGRGRRAPGGG
ncbi:MAG: efflux RND transporter periplasmic adaptor subunit [Planctomycetota bacterium]